MKVKGYVSTGLVGCQREDEVEIPDDELEDLTDAEREALIEDYVKDWAFQYVEWGWKD